MPDLLSRFSDPTVVASYAEGPPRFVPGFSDLHRVAAILIAERTPEAARLLILGAGGGLELKAFAEAQQSWTFDGVDPSAEMLRLAQFTLGPLAPRARLIEGYIEDAPLGPYDGAACLLTLHFLAPDERLRTLREIRRRLKAGAPFVVAHSSFPQQGDARSLWLSRYAAFAIASGAPAADAEKMRAAVEGQLSMLSPEQDQAILQDAGFADLTLFYAAFSWRGWVAYA